MAKRSSLVSSAGRTGLFRKNALGSLAGAGLLALGAGCGPGAADDGPDEAASVFAALAAAAPAQSCGDHADDEGSDTQAVRDDAARAASAPTSCTRRTPTTRSTPTGWRCGASSSPSSRSATAW